MTQPIPIAFQDNDEGPVYGEGATGDAEQGDWWAEAATHPDGPWKRADQPMEVKNGVISGFGPNIIVAGGDVTTIYGRIVWVPRKP